MKAIEFFSGIGGFAQAAGPAGIDVIAAYDQDAAANRVYEMNYGLKPRSRNLDSIKANDIPPADLWWLSPPCTPYTVRGAQKDSADARAKSILNLIALISKLRPQALLIENVLGFSQSKVLQYLKETLDSLSYRYVELSLCPTQFGVPMKRPRYFLCASSGNIGSISRLPNIGSHSAEQSGELRPLAQYLDSGDIEKFKVSDDYLLKHWQGLNVVDAKRSGERTICFTSAYGKCLKASGSLLQTESGSVRRFAPKEILNLLGFSDKFILSPALSLTKQWKLVGNSVEVRCARVALQQLPICTDIGMKILKSAHPTANFIEAI